MKAGGAGPVVVVVVAVDDDTSLATTTLFGEACCPCPDNAAAANPSAMANKPMSGVIEIYHRRILMMTMKMVLNRPVSLVTSITLTQSNPT